MPDLVLGVPAAIVNLVQTGMLERAFYDGLYPALQYRSEAQLEEWQANTGTEIYMSRPGLLTPVTKALQPGADPIPQNVNYEQWVARLGTYSNTVDTHIPTSVVANADLFMRNINQLGLNAGQSVNRLPRNALFTSYLSGATALISAAGAGDRNIRVASINGFTDVITKGTNVRPAPVSSASPLAITIGTSTNTVTGYVADNPDDPFGPGTLLLGAVVGGSGFAARVSVLSVAKPLVIRSGGGSSVDAIGSGDVLQLQDIINAVNKLRRNNVQPHEDGFYHCHLDNDGNSQLFTDPSFQRLNTGLPDYQYYREAFVGAIAGCACFLNSEAPDYEKAGARTATGTNAFYSEEIGAETTNESNVNIGRAIITGRGAIYERYLDENQFVTEAGVTGKTGSFEILNNGVAVSTEQVRLILRAPINRLMNMVSASWSITTSFPIPSDITSGGPQRFKRAVCIEHAMD